MEDSQEINEHILDKELKKLKEWIKEEVVGIFKLIVFMLVWMGGLLILDKFFIYLEYLTILL